MITQHLFKIKYAYIRYLFLLRFLVFIPFYKLYYHIKGPIFTSLPPLKREIIVKIILNKKHCARPALGFVTSSNTLKTAN